MKGLMRRTAISAVSVVLLLAFSAQLASAQGKQSSRRCDPSRQRGGEGFYGNHERA